MKILFRNCLFIVISVILLLNCKEANIPTTEELAKPNVLIILTDDQGYGDLAYHGNPILKTPHLDEFAATSLELTNFHVGTTCAPTRAGLLTGRNANRNNAWHTIAGCSILLEDEETLPEVFENNGYRTTMFGKWHLGDNYPFRPFDRGFQHAFYLGGGGVNQTPDFWNNDYFDDTYLRNGIPEKTSGYCTDVWFNEAIEYLNTPNDEPFFMYLALNAAHGPFNVPESYAKIYESDPLTEQQKRFYGMISNIDDNLGRLISHLKKTGQYDNTILIFTTDNGTAAGITKGNKEQPLLGYNAGLRGTKGSHYDGGHRVPFFISWPNGDILQKTKRNALTAHVDILPTLAEMIGLNFESKKILDGASIANVLQGKEEDIDRMLVVDTQRNQWPEKGKNSCVMSSEWRLIDGKELYNLADDQGQVNDLADKHPDLVSEMNLFYDKWWAGVEPEIKYAEIPLGNEIANPVTITVHDMHTTEALPWNQVQIREGKLFPEGYYSVKVQDEGEYSFKLYRYPPESGLSLNATPEEIPGTSYLDYLPKGEMIAVKNAMVEIGGNTILAATHLDQPYIELKTNLKPGSHTLKSNFITAGNLEIPAYYIQIEKL